MNVYSKVCVAVLTIMGGVYCFVALKEHMKEDKIQDTRLKEALVNLNNAELRYKMLEDLTKEHDGE